MSPLPFTSTPSGFVTFENLMNNRSAYITRCYSIKRHSYSTMQLNMTMIAHPDLSIVKLLIIQWRWLYSTSIMEEELRLRHGIPLTDEGLQTDRYDTKQKT